MKYSYPKLLEILLAEKRPALATIVEVKGSAPQVPGASAVFSRAGLLVGTVGGGLLEAKAGEVAGTCLEDGKCRLVTFRLDADSPEGEGAICGGEATVLLDPGINGERLQFEAIVEGLKGRELGILLTRIGPPDGDVVEVSREYLSAAEMKSSAGPSSSPGYFTSREIDGLISTAKPLLKNDDGALLFAEPVLPLPRLIIAGAGHIGRAVARLGDLLDFEVTVIDDRPEFANRESIPDADAVIVGDIGATIREIPAFSDDYYVIVTRGHRNDAEALRGCVAREAAYIGMIGSKTKVALMKEEFLGKGWATAEQWNRVHAPIGLEIRSQTVEEIAVSIAAELVLVRSGLRDRKEI